jgi:hypothetical protein
VKHYPPTAAIRGIVTLVEGMVGLYGKLTLARPSLSSAPGLEDGQCARPGQPPTLSVGESDTCKAEFGRHIRSEP